MQNLKLIILNSNCCYFSHFVIALQVTYVRKCWIEKELNAKMCLTKLSRNNFAWSHITYQMIPIGFQHFYFTHCLFMKKIFINIYKLRSKITFSWHSKNPTTHYNILLYKLWYYTLYLNNTQHIHCSSRKPFWRGCEPKLWLRLDSHPLPNDNSWWTASHYPRTMKK